MDFGAIGEREHAVGVVFHVTGEAGIRKAGVDTLQRCRHQLQSLVDHVCAQVDELATTAMRLSTPGAWCAILTPGKLRVDPFAELTISQQLLQRQIVTIPTTVLEDSQQPA